MALPLANTFEGGTDNTTITTGNSGGSSGNAFDSVTAGTVCKFENSQFMHGGLSFEFSTGGVAESSFVSWVASMGTQTTVYGRFYVRFTAAPGSNSSILSTLSGASVRARLQWTTAQKLRVLDAAAGTVWTSTTTLSLNTWYRVEFQFTHDASAGTAQIKLFTGDSTSATEDSGSLTAINFGGTSADRIRYGCVVNATNFPQTWMDEIQVNGTGFPGPSNTTVSASISTAFTVTTSTSATVKVPASISTSFSVGTAVAATVKVPATVTTSFAVSMSTSATVTVPAAVSTAFSVGTAAAATVTVPAAISTSFAFSAPVAATVTAGSVPSVQATSTTTLTARRTSVAAVTARRTSAPSSSAGRSSAPTVSGG